jgi:hypothetical protein
MYSATFEPGQLPNWDFPLQEAPKNLFSTILSQFFVVILLQENQIILYKNKFFLNDFCIVRKALVLNDLPTAGIYF